MPLVQPIPAPLQNRGAVFPSWGITVHQEAEEDWWNLMRNWG